MKTTGDRAFCLGVNQLILHMSAHQPWSDVRPGMTMGPWGTHLGRTQTWWEQSPVWFAYLTRCQYLLQAGQFVGDICFLEAGAVCNLEEERTLPAGYDGDFCSVELFLQGMTVKNGRLVLPCGMTYRVLALPDRTTMTPAVVRKLRALVEADAVVVGPKPKAAPSLQDYPGCDAEVRRIADELWDSGKVISDKPVAQVLADSKTGPDFQAGAENLLWIHRQMGDAEVYFDLGWDDTCCGTFYIPIFPGGLVGVYLPNLFMSPDTTFRFEFTNTTRTQFTHSVWQDGYERKGQVISDFVGTNGQDFFFRLTRRLSPEIDVGIEFDLARIGQVESGQAFATKELKRYFGVDVSYKYSPALSLTVAARLEWVTNRDFVQGQKDINPVYTAAVTYAFDPTIGAGKRATVPAKDVPQTTS